MAGRGTHAGGGGRGQGSGGRGLEGGTGQRRRDGSGGGTCLGRDAGAVQKAATTGLSPVSAETAGAQPVEAPATPIAARTRWVATVARLASCIACGTCVETCPRGAIALEETAVIDLQLCNGCGLCVSDCSYGALEMAEV